VRGTSKLEFIRFDDDKTATIQFRTSAGALCSDCNLTCEIWQLTIYDCI